MTNANKVDEIAVRELDLYQANTETLYNGQFLAIVKNLMKHIKKGTFTFDLSVKLWKYYADNVCKKYQAENAMQKTGFAFSVQTRQALAMKLAEDFKQSADSEEYNWILEKE